MKTIDEYILCAAIKLIKPRKIECYYNNDLDICEIGYRHCDIFYRFKETVSRNPKDQGFYTSKGRFVSREEALLIAKNANQINGDVLNRLYSENLY